MKTPKQPPQGGLIPEGENVLLGKENGSEGLYEAPMRKIEFRGYDLEMKRWYYGYYVRREESSAYPMSPDPIGDAIKHELEQVKHYIVWDEHMDWGLATVWKKASVDARSIGQWTGRYDSEHQKIFEGDIYLHKFRAENGRHETIDVIESPDPEWLFETDDWGENSVTIIGNAYEQQ